MERALAAVHKATGIRQPFTLCFSSQNGKIGMFISCPDHSSESILGPITANYPQCVIAPQDESADQVLPETVTSDILLVPELFPILRHAQFEDQLNRNFADPLATILHAIRPDESTNSRIEIICTPATHARCHAALRYVHRLEREFFRRHHRLARFYAGNVSHGPWRWLAWLLGWFATQSAQHSLNKLETSPGRAHDREENLQAAAHKLGCQIFEVGIRIAVYHSAGQRAIAKYRLTNIEAALGSLTRTGLASFKTNRLWSQFRRFTGRRPSFLMSHEELATLWHPLTSTAAVERMESNTFAELEAPSEFHSEKEEGSVVLGRVRFRDDQRLVVLGQEDRRRHLYITGKTGMGKTTLLQNMIVSDMTSGRGLCLVDPHGDLAESVLRLVPSHRTNDVISFDASDREVVVPFNPLACRNPERIDQVTSGVVSSFKRLHESWGPRLEDTLRNAVFAIVEQGGNLMAVLRLLGEKPFRDQTVMRIRDEVVRSFWLHEFSSWSDNYRTEAVAAILNKVRPFLSHTNIRQIVNHPGPSLDLRNIMDDGKILIANLSKGRLGEDNSMLLGAFLVTSIQQAAMTRADIPETDRTDFTIFVDEFQNFISTSSFASVLSEARKYRLGLVIAHQYLRQLDEETANAVWGNVGSMFAFQVGNHDAKILASELSKYDGQINPENLTNTPKYLAYARLLIDGLPSNPFSIESLAPKEIANPNRANLIRQLMVRKFGKPQLKSFV